MNTQITVNNLNHSNDSFNWKKIAEYSAFLGLFASFVAVFNFLTDDIFISSLLVVLTPSITAKYLFFTLVSIWLFLAGMKRKACHPDHTLRNELILIFGAVTTILAVIYLGEATNAKIEYLIIFTTMLFVGLGLWLPSKPILWASLLILPVWFTIKTGYFSNFIEYFLK